MKQAKLILLFSLYFIANLNAQTPYVLTTPAINEAGVNSSVTGSCGGGNTVTITRVDLAGNPLNFRTVGATATLQLPLVVNTDQSTNWTAGGTSPVYGTVPTYVRFDSRDNFAYPAVTPTLLPAQNRYRLQFTFSPATTNPVINFSGTANREIVALVPATVTPSVPVLALDGSTGGRFTTGGTFLPSPTYTLITNGIRFTGSHGSDRYNVGIQLTGSITTAIIELSELTDVGSWVNSAGASIWSQIDNMGVAVSGSCTVLPIKLESFTGNLAGNIATLNWKTQTEYDVLNHQVEMSNNGIDFEKIGTIAALNLSGSVYSFNYTLGSEKNYYFRLKTVDRNGSFTYSNIIRLTNTRDKSFSAKISPNPAQDFITIQLPYAEKVDLQLFNSVGNQVLTKFSIRNNTTNISINTLPKGVYFLKVTNSAGEYLVQKIIKE
jgi:hypothetical protein